MKRRSFVSAMIAGLGVVAAIALLRNPSPASAGGEKAEAPEAVELEREKAEEELSEILARLWTAREGKRVSIEGVSWGMKSPGKESGLPEIQFRMGHIDAFLSDPKIKEKWKDGRLVRVIGTLKVRTQAERLHAVGQREGRPGRMQPQMVLQSCYGVEVEQLHFVDEISSPGVTALGFLKE